jgi:GT2 family glycosyltransferase
MTAELCAVIVNWNAGPALIDCVRSLRDTAGTDALDVIVVDNASGDGSIDALRAAEPWVRVIANATNRGLSAANNQGLLATDAPNILISNPDVVYRPGAIAAMTALLERRPRAAFAIPRLVHPTGVLQTSAGDLPTLLDALGGRRMTRRKASGSTTGFWWDGWAHDEERQIGHGMEAAYLVRRAAVDEIGLQDEGFPLDWEGIDWAARVNDGGWEVWFTPAAEVVHKGGVSIRQAERAWIIRSHRGMYRYFSKRRSPLVRPVLAAAFALRAGVKLAAATAGGVYQSAHPGSTGAEP